MNELDIEKMVYFCHKGLFEFLQMLFGLRNAQVTLQCALDLIMEEVIWEEVLLYLDDLIICTPSFEVFLMQLEYVF